jgi:hypothetical protein
VHFNDGTARHYDAEDYQVLNGANDRSPQALQLRKSNGSFITIAGGEWRSVEILGGDDETEQIVKS